uniref:Putative cytochrome p450 6g2 n=1 Tax=Haematobia irritans TaxID=7368 RepID=A0A1L8EGW7_HAEIR
MVLAEIFIFLVTVSTVFWLWLRYRNQYWKRANIPYIKPHPLFGNFKEIALWQNDPCTHFKKLYESIKDNVPCVGIYVFHRPGLLVKDLNLIKNILIKDFNMFSNRYSASDPHTDSIGANNLFFVKNPKWKEIRAKLTPVFTSGKIKQMFHLVEEIGRNLDKHLCSLTDVSRVHEVKEINALFTTDVIASIAFGVLANSLEDPKGEFRRNGARVFEFTYRRAAEFTSMFFVPQLVKPLHFKTFSSQTSDFLRNAMTHVIEERMKSTMHRNDLIDVLVNFRKEAEKDPTHFANNMDLVIGQAAIFFTAGFETSSATMSFSLYELAKHQDIQSRLREEIRSVLLQSENGQPSYEQINEMKFLHNVILEVLRMYPPLPFLDRECTAPQGYSLKPFFDFTIPPGMPIYIPASAIQRDEKYFPDPDRFEPDRFNPENKLYNNLMALMPFGIGPHNCIGERFGLLQAKVGLINFLRNHYVTPCKQTPVEMKLSPKAIIIQSEDGIYLNLNRDPLIKSQ